MASVQLKSGEYYFETIDDEKTPLINQLTVSQFLIDNNDVFYKNNKNRKFEQLISTKHLSNLDLNNEDSNVFKKIWDVFSEWDQMLNLKNFKTSGDVVKKFASITSILSVILFLFLK